MGGSVRPRRERSVCPAKRDHGPARLIAAEAARPTEHPDALDYILRGRAARLKPKSRNVYAEAISLFERALALDPRSVEARSLVADALASRVKAGMTDSATTDIARAEALVGQALAASSRSATVHFAIRSSLAGPFAGRYSADAVVKARRRAVADDPG